MDKMEFMRRFAELTEESPENITEATELESLECWDSLAKVSFIAFAATECGVLIGADDLVDPTTVGELFAMLESKKANG